MAAALPLAALSKLLKVVGSNTKGTAKGGGAGGGSKKVVRLRIALEESSDQGASGGTTSFVVFQFEGALGERRRHRYVFNEQEVMAAIFDTESASSLAAQPLQLNALLDHLRTLDVSFLVSPSRLKVRSYHNPVTVTQAGGGPGGPAATVLTTEMSVSSSEFDHFNFLAPDGGPLPELELGDGTDKETEVELVFGLREIKALITFCLMAETDGLSLHFVDNGAPLQVKCQPEDGRFSAELFLSTMQTDDDAPRRSAEREERLEARRSQEVARGLIYSDTQQSRASGSSHLTSLPNTYTANDSDRHPGGDHLGQRGYGDDNQNASGGYGAGTPYESSAGDYGRDPSQHPPPTDPFTGDHSYGSYDAVGTGMGDGDCEIQDKDHVGAAQRGIHDGDTEATSPVNVLESKSQLSPSTPLEQPYDPADSFAGPASFDRNASEVNSGSDAERTNERQVCGFPVASPAIQEESPELLVEESPRELVGNRAAVPRFANRPLSQHSQRPQPSQAPSVASQAEDSESMHQGVSSWYRRRGRDPAAPLLHESHDDECAAGEAEELESEDNAPLRQHATSHSTVEETPQKPWPEEPSPSGIRYEETPEQVSRRTSASTTTKTQSSSTKTPSAKASVRSAHSSEQSRASGRKRSPSREKEPRQVERRSGSRSASRSGKR